MEKHPFKKNPMERLSTKQSAVETALPTVPNVLCVLIAEYAIDQAYRWFAGAIRNDDKTNKTKTIEPAILDLNEYGQLLVHRDTGDINNAWYNFVTTADMRTGAPRWTIGYRTADAKKGWIGIGTTTESTTFRTGNQLNNISTSRSWIFRYLSGRPGVYHAGQQAVVCPTVDGRSFDWPTAKPTAIWPSVGETRWLHFFADRDNLRILVRVRGYDDGSAFVLMQTDSADLFDSMRVCVAASGQIDVLLVNDP